MSKKQAVKVGLRILNQMVSSARSGSVTQGPRPISRHPVSGVRKPASRAPQVQLGGGERRQGTIRKPAIIPTRPRSNSKPAHQQLEDLLETERNQRDRTRRENPSRGRGGRRPTPSSGYRDEPSQREYPIPVPPIVDVPHNPHIPTDTVDTTPEPPYRRHRPRRHLPDSGKTCQEIKEEWAKIGLGDLIRCTGAGESADFRITTTKR